MPNEKERALEIVQETENEILRRCRSLESANRIFSPDDLRAAALLRAQAEALEALKVDRRNMREPEGRLNFYDAHNERIVALRAAAAELEEK